MTPTFADAEKRVIGSVVRWLLTLCFAGLATHKVVDGQVLGMAIDEATARIVGSSGALLMLAWSQIQKWYTTKKIATALVMPPSSTPGDLAVVMKVTQPGMLPSAPPPSAATGGGDRLTDTNIPERVARE